MFLLEGRPLSPDVPFKTADGTQYPANWLRLSTPEERENIGITEQADEQSWDQRWSWGYDAEGELIWKDHAQLVEQWVAQTRTTAGTLLTPTDWMVIREADNATPTPEPVKTLRQEIRTACNEKVVAIEATADTEALAAYLTGSDYPTWPPYVEPVPADDAGDSPADGVELDGNGGEN